MTIVSNPKSNKDSIKLHVCTFDLLSCKSQSQNISEEIHNFGPIKRSPQKTYCFASRTPSVTFPRRRHFCDDFFDITNNVRFIIVTYFSLLDLSSSLQMISQKLRFASSCFGNHYQVGIVFVQCGCLALENSA